STIVASVAPRSWAWPAAARPSAASTGSVRVDVVRIASPSIPGSIQVAGMLLEERERHDVERPAVRALQPHARRHPVLIRLEPTRGTQAPAVARLQSRKLELGARRRQIVAAETRELEELFRHLDANRVRADILGARVAAAVAEEARSRPLAACLERLAEHVQRRLHAQRSAPSIVGAPKPRSASGTSKPTIVASLATALAVGRTLVALMASPPHRRHGAVILLGSLGSRRAVRDR